MGKSVTPSRSRPRPKGTRILIVEANAGYRSVISHVVELAGGEFESVAEFDSAMRQIEKSTRFDMVILGMSAESRIARKVLGELRAAAGAPFILLNERPPSPRPPSALRRLHLTSPPSPDAA